LLLNNDNHCFQLLVLPTDKNGEMLSYWLSVIYKKISVSAWVVSHCAGI